MIEKCSDQKVKNMLDCVCNTNTTITSAGSIDTQLVEDLYFGLLPISITDGTYTLKIYESDESDMTDASLVTNTIFSTNPTASVATSAGEYVRQGCYDTKRYVQPRVTSASVSTGAHIDVVAVITPKLKPVDQA